MYPKEFTKTTLSRLNLAQISLMQKHSTAPAAQCSELKRIHSKLILALCDIYEFFPSNDIADDLKDLFDIVLKGKEYSHLVNQIFHNSQMFFKDCSKNACGEIEKILIGYAEGNEGDLTRKKGIHTKPAGDEKEDDLIRRNRISTQFGICGVLGFGIKISREEVIRSFEKSAEQNYAPAQYYLGCCYAPSKKAVDFFQKSAEQNYAPAQYELGLCYLDNKGVEQSVDNVKKAVDFFRKAADQNYAPAQYELGLCYLDNKGVEQSVDNVKKAVDFFQKAAEQNYTLAQYQLGLYYKEKGNTIYNLEAVKMFQRAVDQEYAPAQYELGLCYFHHKGVGGTECDSRVVAIELFQKAANQKYDPALEQLAELRRLENLRKREEQLKCEELDRLHTQEQLRQKSFVPASNGNGENNTSHDHNHQRHKLTKGLFSQFMMSNSNNNQDQGNGSQPPLKKAKFSREMPTYHDRRYED